MIQMKGQIVSCFNPATGQQEPAIWDNPLLHPRFLMTTELKQCLCCGGALTHIIDFGPTRLANTYGVEEKFPLALKLCVECYHLQLTHSVAPEILFKDYRYCSGTGRTARAFFGWFANMVMRAKPGAKRVLDIACNDGTQLDYFKAFHGVATYGCDPAENLAAIARKSGHRIYEGMFETMPYDGIYDVITAQNVLAHTPQPLAFLQNAARMMHKDTRLFVTTSQADMIPKGECDTVYHEHASYFNCNSMKALGWKAGLTLLDVATHPIHGTSYIFTFALGTDGQPGPRAASRLAIETQRGMFTPDTYWAWALTAKRAIARFQKNISWHKEQGYATCGLGAAAKGISMLNMAGVKLDYLFDTTPAKQGKVASGMLIQPFEEIAALKAEKVLFVILAWNFEQEVRENVATLRDNPNDVFVTDK